MSAVKLARRALSRIAEFISEHPVVWILIALASGLCALGFIVALVAPVWDWDQYPVATRVSLAGVLVSFFSLVAAVSALFYALAEVRQVFPTQRIVFEAHSIFDTPPNPSQGGVKSLQLSITFSVPESAPIVNAYRIAVDLYLDGYLIDDDSHQISESFDRTDVRFVGRRNPWQSALWLGWSTESERPWFPGVMLFGPLIDLSIRPDGATEFVSGLSWKGRWWTDREGPVDFEIPVSTS